MPAGDRVFMMYFVRRPFVERVAQGLDCGVQHTRRNGEHTRYRNALSVRVVAPKPLLYSINRFDDGV